MSWTNECIVSNYFEVKHITEVKHVIERLGLCTSINNNKIMLYNSGEGDYFDDNAEVILSIKPIEKVFEENEVETTNMVDVISDNTIETFNEILEINDLEEKDVICQNIVEYLQDELIDEKQAIIITTAGFDERCSEKYNPFGDVQIITKNNYTGMNLYNWTENTLKGLGIEWD